MKSSKFMCALGGCKKQCFICKEDENCDKQWINYKNKLNLTNAPKKSKIRKNKKLP